MNDFFRCRTTALLVVTLVLTPCWSWMPRDFHSASPPPHDKLLLLLTRQFSWSKRQKKATVLKADAITACSSLGAACQQQSYVSCIRSKNLAGVVSQCEEEKLDEDIIIQLDRHSHLVAVTGETGSGKSLLVARAIELVTGGKASASLILGVNQPEDGVAASLDVTANSASVEIELTLKGDYLQAAKAALNQISVGLSATLQEQYKDDDGTPSAKIVIARDLLLQPSPSGKARPRLKSVCRINDQQVTLKALVAFSSLLTVVDASTASTALARPDARLSIVDTGVSDECLMGTQDARRRYNRARRKRIRLEKELSNGVLPKSFSRDSEQDMEMLDHWIDKLDAFEKRIENLCRYATVEDKNSVLYRPSRRLGSAFWMETTDDTDCDASHSSSVMYDALVEFRDAVKGLDSQLEAARNAVNSLSALSSPESAATAVERARGFLFDSIKGSGDDSSSSRLVAAAERSHELLNSVESALAACARFVEDDERGLLQTLETARQGCPIPLEDIEGILLDWNSLARKHMIPPDTLPSCHQALKNERDGNVQARELLPRAIVEEESALKEFEEMASTLTRERQEVARSLSSSVTDRLPSLGMESSVFLARVIPRRSKSNDSSLPQSDDVVEFFLFRKDDNDGGQRENGGGQVNEVASSGEKARILLAIECALPGSVGASCTRGKQSEDASSKSLWPGLPPIAVVYDEIDAHVGGRAAVAMSGMLVDQSRWSQVFAITHSPSVAAVADTHVVVQRIPRNDSDGRRNTIVVKAQAVDGPERTKELARMASGDIATEEAEIFAEALIRDGSKVKNHRT